MAGSGKQAGARAKMKRKFDFLVIGAGIAGLAISELLQRSGVSVCLVEANDKICAETTSQQHGWFHTGALYAALPSPRFFRQLIGNIDDLLNYYAGFPGMNLRSGRHLVTTEADGWFSTRLVSYFYANASDTRIPLIEKPLWYLACLLAKGRLSWFETLDFTRELSHQISPFSFDARFSRVTRKRTLRNLNLPCKGSLLVSRDRTIDVHRVISDLVSSFVGCGGVIRVNTTIREIDGNSAYANDYQLHANHIIVAAGRSVKDLTRVAISSFLSPMMVVAPSPFEENIVFMHPDPEYTLTHISHGLPNGRKYSVISGAMAIPESEYLDESEICRKFLLKANSVLARPLDPSNAKIFFGRKNEILFPGQERNYGYAIIDAENCTVAVPGKLSLCFSLAVNVCRHFGISPCANVGSFDVGVKGDIMHCIRHFSIAMEQYGGKEVARQI